LQKELLSKAKASIENCDVGQIDIKAKKALHVLDKEEMIKILQESKKYNHESQLLKDIDYYLHKAPEKEVVEKELEIAKRDDDKPRIIHREIRLTEIILNDSSNEYKNFNTYKLYRDMDAYAKPKFFGKQKFKDTLYTYHNKANSNSLLQSDDKLFIKECIKMNKLLLKFSQKEDYESMSSILYMVNNSKLHDELYLQIMKQITQNPNSQEVKLLYDALALATIFIKPSLDLEMYVRMFCKNHADYKHYSSSMNNLKYNNEEVDSLPIADKIPDVLNKTFKKPSGSRFSITDQILSGPTRKE